MHDERSVSWLFLYVVGGVLLTALAAFPWWMDEGAFALDTVWARVAVVCGIAIAGVGVLMLRGALAATSSSSFPSFSSFRWSRSIYVS